MLLFLHWSQVVLVVFAGGTLIGACVAGVVSDRWVSRLQSIAPGPRFALLSTFALLPLAAGLVSFAIAFGPSILDMVGVVADHCRYHPGHAFHLCFVHADPPPVSPLVWGGGLILLLWLGASFNLEADGLRHANSWSTTLSKIAHFDEDVDAWTIASHRPIAAVVGWLQPKIYISEGLRDLLSAPQTQAVLAHERAHARRRHSLVKLVVRLAAQFHFPFVREPLLDEIDLACEQACDEVAAEAVGDRITVAEALLTVERASRIGDMPERVVAFGGHGLEKRVRAMVEDSWERPAYVSITAGCGAALALLLIVHRRLHHTAESLLSLIL